MLVKVKRDGVRQADKDIPIGGFIDLPLNLVVEYVWDETIEQPTPEDFVKQLGRDAKSLGLDPFPPRPENWPKPGGQQP